MMKALIVSDSHRQNDNFVVALEREEPVDMVIHCGDIEGSEYFYAQSSGCPVYMVMGNNDFFSALSKEVELELEGYRILVTHGHYYYVSNSNALLKDEARARGFDIVLYGHTHRPVIDIEDDVIAVNPGSLTYPRQDGKRPSYAVMEIDDHGEVLFEIKYI